VILSRRTLLAGGGAVAAWSLGAVRAAAATRQVEIEMRGRMDGSRVWFDPIGLAVAPGTTIRWINRDPGNAHTATAYHPAVGRRQRRIPGGAEPWDSGYLMPGDSFSVTLGTPGVYDYYCLPHEQAGMVGRIVVGAATAANPGPAGSLAPPPDAALRAFPTLGEIALHGIVRTD